MQSSRLWGTEIAGLEECLGGLVARFQKTNVPLEVDEEQRCSPFSVDTRSRLGCNIESPANNAAARISPGCALARQREGYCLLLFPTKSLIVTPSSLFVTSSSRFPQGTDSVRTRFEGLKARRTIARLALTDFVGRSFHASCSVCISLKIHACTRKRTRLWVIGQALFVQSFANYRTRTNLRRGVMYRVHVGACFEFSVNR